MIIAGGFNIYPREIDEVLFQHPKIQEAVCVGLADEYRGETVKAYVVLKEGATATAEEIVDFCKETPGRLQSAQAGGIPGDPAQVGGREDPAEGAAG